MDSLDFSTFFTIDTIAKRERETFLKANGLNTFESVRHLIYINYILQTRGGYCYDLDVAHLKKTERAKLPLVGVRRRLYMMQGEGLVSYVRSEDLHPVLKRRYTITDKGYSVLDNYEALYMRLKKDFDYLLKKVRKDADNQK